MNTVRSRAQDDRASWRALIGLLVIAWCVVAAQAPGLPQGLDLPSAAAASLIAAGIGALVAGMPLGLTAIVLVAGVVWLAPTLLPLGVGTPPADGTTGGLAPLLPLVLVPPAAWMLGRRRSSRATQAALLLGAGGLLAVAVRAVTVDPFFVPGCGGCDHVPALLEPGPDVRLAVRAVEAALALLAGAWLLGTGLSGLADGRRRDRVVVAASVGAVLAGGATVITVSLVLLRWPTSPAGWAPHGCPRASSSAP